MASSPHYDKYGMTAKRFTVILCALGGAACGAALKLQGVWSYGAIVLAVVMLLRGARIATITSRDGITVRRFFGAKKVPWADIQDIRVKVNTLSLYPTKYTKGTPNLLAAIYDRRGKEIILPNLNEETLGEDRSLDVEMGNICSTWEQLRGDDWRLVPEVAKIIDKKQDAPEWLERFVLAFVCGFLVMIVGLFLALFAHVPWLVTFWILPAMAFLAVMFAPVIARARKNIRNRNSRL